MQNHANSEGSLICGAHTTHCCPGIVWAVLNITQLQQLIARAAAEIALVETGHSICSALTLKVVQWRERLFKKAQAAQMKRAWCQVKVGQFLKLRLMQHISELPPPCTDSTRCYVSYKLAGGEDAKRSPQPG